MVAWIIGVSSGVPDGGLEDPLVLRRRVVLQEYMLHSPEATARKRGDFGSDFSCTAGEKWDEFPPRTRSEIVGGLTWGRHGVKCAVERF